MSDKTELAKIAWKEAKEREKTLEKQLELFDKIYKAMEKTVLSGEHKLDPGKLLQAIEALRKEHKQEEAELKKKINEGK